MDDYGQAAMGAIAQAAANLAAPAVEGKTSWKYTKKAMELQNQYNIEAFERSNERQDYLMQNANIIAKDALRRAGYSTADPNGTGVTPAPLSSQNTNAASPIHVSAPNLDVVGNMARMSEINLMKAQANKLEAETDMQYILNDLKERFGEQEVIANLNNLDSESLRNFVDSMKADQDRLNSIVITDVTKKNIEERLEMDWQKLEPELAIMCEQVENLKREGKVKEAQEKAIYQDIKESGARINRLMKENELTDADIAVAKASEKLRKQELATEKNRTSSEASRAKAAKVEADAKKALGHKYYAAKEVVDEITKTGERIGNTVSSFIPFTDKVETTHDVVENRYDGSGNVVGQRTTFSHDTRSSSRHR